jgi:hypothetical protein
MPGHLDAPIPGQSLTSEPGNVPWEQPPLYASVEQALAFHLKNLSKPDTMDDMMFLLSQDCPLNVLVESMTSYAAMEGYHTVDVSTLIQPVLHEYIKSMAEAGGVKVKEDDSPSQEEKDKLKFKQRLGVVLNKEMGGDNNPEENIADSVGIPATPEQTDPETELAKMNADEPKPSAPGFINRRK